MVFAALALSQVAFGPSDASSVDAVLKEALAKKQTVGAGVVVVKGGRVVYAKGYGLADREKKTPATEHTRFEIGSVTKQFAATILMQLVGEHKVDLDAPITRYVPKLPKVWSKVKVRHVLTHTGGLPNYTETVPETSLVLKTGSDWDAVNGAAKKPLGFAPGAKFEYSNTGYTVVGLIIEAIEHRSFDESLRTRILKPLGMTETSLLAEGRKSPNAAMGYDGAKRAIRVGAGWPGAAGAIMSTAADMGKWLVSLGSPKLLPEAAWKQMWSPTKLSGGGVSQYGFGFAFADRAGTPTIEHAGGINGFNSDLLLVRSKSLAVVVLSNVDGTSASSIALNVAHAVDNSFRADPPAVKDERPARTASDRQLLIDALDGKLDETKLAPELKKLVQAQKGQFGQLKSVFGPLKSLTFTGEKVVGGSISRRYTAAFENEKVQFIVEIDAKGIITALGLRPM